MGSVGGGLVLGEKSMARQWAVGMVGRGLGRSEGQGTAPSMCSIFSHRHEVIEFD